MTNNCRMDGANMGRVQDKLVGYLEDSSNVNYRAPYGSLYLVDASLSKRVCI
jgi:hypothetical protein